MPDAKPPTISFSDGLAIGAIVLTIVFLVLDKAGKLKGPILFWLLGLAALMTVPLVLGNQWVGGSPNGTAKIFRIVFLFCAVGSAMVHFRRGSLQEKNLTQRYSQNHQPSRACPRTRSTLLGLFL
jgi:hypothetical protein